MQTFHRTFISKSPRDYAEVLAPRMYNYGWGYPMPVFLFVVLLVYSTTTPLILVFGTFYYCLSYLVVKYQLLYGKSKTKSCYPARKTKILSLVYFHPYEVAGRMWPLVFSRIIVGLLLFETLAAGLFVLNKAYTLALLCTPLVLMTLLFNFGVDQAYQKSTQYLPLQLLSERFGPLTTTVTAPPTRLPSPEPVIAAPKRPQPSSPPHPGAALLRRRRTVLDEDDYEAQARKYTNFKEPPMTLLDGILNTGMKRYAHPAFLGVLPQLWLPIKADKHYKYQPLVDQEGNLQSTDPDTAPLLVESPSPLISRSVIPHEQEIPSDEEDSMEDETTANGTYYHHPERRMSKSKSLLSRSYGAV